MLKRSCFNISGKSKQTEWNHDNPNLTDVQMTDTSQKIPKQFFEVWFKMRNRNKD